jgi:hypothetical protein
VLQDARAAGFAIVALRDPFTRRSGFPQDEFIGLRSRGTVRVVDVRGNDSFATGHIPGAISIPLAAIEGSVEQLRGLAQPVGLRVLS